MEGKPIIRVLLLLLALVSLAHADILARFPGSGAKGGSRPGSRPQRPAGSKPRPSLEALGIGSVIVGTSLEHADEAEKQAFEYKLGSYDDPDQLPFAENTGEMAHFYSKVYDFFAASDSSVQAQAEATPFPDSGPFEKDGRPDGNPITATRTATYDDGSTELVTSVFNPAKATDVCLAWSSLDRYCNGYYIDIDTSCICYSSTYYVASMWNSLAAGCASITSSCEDDNTSAECKIRRAALAAATYCPTSDYDTFYTISARFGAHDAVSTQDASSDDGEMPMATGAASSGSDSGDDGEGGDDNGDGGVSGDDSQDSGSGSGGGGSDDSQSAAAGQAAATSITPATTTADTTTSDTATASVDNPGGGTGSTQAPGAAVTAPGLVTTSVSGYLVTFSNGYPVFTHTGAVTTASSSASAARGSSSLASKALALLCPAFLAYCLAF